MTLEDLNRLPIPDAQTELLRCCGSRRWAKELVAMRPFPDLAGLLANADLIWSGLSKEDWLEAFSRHPRIGDAKSLREKFAATAKWAGEEQRGAAGASDDLLIRLAEGNAEYEKRFGYIFIVCATGKSAEEMLSFLEARLVNPPEQEIRIAVGEQAKITKIRLEKLLS